MGRNSGKRLIGWKGHRPLQEGVQSKTHIPIYFLCKGAVSEKATKPALEAAIKKILNSPGFSSCLCLWSNSSFLLPLPDDTLRKTQTQQNAVYAATQVDKNWRTREIAYPSWSNYLFQSIRKIICNQLSPSAALNQELQELQGTLWHWQTPCDYVHSDKQIMVQYQSAWQYGKNMDTVEMWLHTCKQIKTTHLIPSNTHVLVE